MSPRVKPSLPPLAVLLLAGALAVLGSARGGQGGAEELPVLWEAPDFRLVDQTGDTLRSGLGALLP